MIGVTAPRARKPRNPGAILSRGRDLFPPKSIQAGSGTHPAHDSMRTGNSFPEKHIYVKQRQVDHSPHLVPMSKISAENLHSSIRQNGVHSDKNSQEYTSVYKIQNVTSNLYSGEWTAGCLARV